LTKLIIAIEEDFPNRLDLEDITYPNSQLQMSLFSLRGFLGGITSIKKFTNLENSE